MFRKSLFTLIMIVLVIALSFFVSSIISRNLGLPVYDVMSAVGIVIMVLGGIFSIDEHTLRHGAISAPHLNMMMNADETGVNKQSNIYRQGIKNIAIEGMGSKLKIILAGAIVLGVSILISLL